MHINFHWTLQFIDEYIGTNMKFSDNHIVEEKILLKLLLKILLKILFYHSSMQMKVYNTNQSEVISMC